MEDSHILNSTHWTLTPATSAPEIGLKELNFHLPKALIPMSGCYCCHVLSVRSWRLVASPVSQFVFYAPKLPTPSSSHFNHHRVSAGYFTVPETHECRPSCLHPVPRCWLWLTLTCSTATKGCSNHCHFETPSFQDHQPFCRPFWDSCRVSQPPPCFTEIPQTSILTRWKRSLPFVHVSQVSDLRGHSENSCWMKGKSDGQLLSQANPLLGVGSWGRQKKISACILAGWQMSLDIPS